MVAAAHRGTPACTYPLDTSRTVVYIISHVQAFLSPRFFFFIILLTHGGGTAQRRTSAPPGSFASGGHGRRVPKQARRYRSAMFSQADRPRAAILTRGGVCLALTKSTKTARASQARLGGGAQRRLSLGEQRHRSLAALLSRCRRRRRRRRRHRHRHRGRRRPPRPRRRLGPRVAHRRVEPSRVTEDQCHSAHGPQPRRK